MGERGVLDLAAWPSERHTHGTFGDNRERLNFMWEKAVLLTEASCDYYGGGASSGRI